MGLVTGVSVDDVGAVAIELRLSSPGCMMGGFYFEPEIKKHVGAIPGVGDIRITFGDPLTWSESDISESGRAALAATRRSKKPPQVPAAGSTGSEGRHGHA
jgi:metal-sulfur cluster biosynthetic enzyme